MQVLATRAQCEGTLGRWDDAIRDGLDLHQLAVKKQGPSSFFAIASLSDAATAQCRAGRYSAGEANARSSYENARKAFGERAGLTGGAADTLADCLIGQNKLEEASRLLETIDAKAVAQLAGVPDWSANLDLSRAEIAYRRGDYATARKEIQPAIAVFSRADAEPYQKRKTERLLLSLERPVHASR
jgi:ATP/maltotriose-dependent transcriptional regulator MalT